MENLIQLLRRVLSDSFVFYVKALNYHWNVEGLLFTQFHDFFGKVYEQVQEGLDDIAEQIRRLDEYAPGTLRRYIELSSLEEQIAVPSLQEMIMNLYNDNNKIINLLNITFEEANKKNEQGLVDFLSSLIDRHKKLRWMLKATMES